MNDFYCCLFNPVLFQVVPSFFAVSSCHLLIGRPLDLFPHLGCHAVQCFVYPLSFIFAKCQPIFVSVLECII